MYLPEEAAPLRFIRRVSNIPVPTLYGAFEVDDSFILITEHIDGVAMSNLSEDQKSIVRTEVEQYLPRKVSKDHEYVFCHNDLGQHNIIVDPQTLKIRAIIDWEYAGRGPSIVLDGEHDDSAELLQFLEAV
ncbi:hypothetical protein P175DRAFT_0505954 [Aspergillus ochraceoroseus IBT 24754]|uniref:Aminoglycoside phosphotransferase domain-containing protein n=1 Tax=Aspergillus ochraceoroseus IBT 24754 TaxID=1392256 RepID=A0A2T5M6Z5_9EURO|nr:uncharacterized protein P175DRAFT_0505954 [Aspergillus ochraceoroseus IBT 24754]PTU24276.1 hypothetical protein P175DRAFT_0505954 [Aspergillus ochraceoroseus IBT 24754]